MSEVGRPTVMTPETLHKLDEAFLNDLTDEQACFFANISPATLYNFQQEHPEFLERKRLLRENLKVKAKLNLSHKIQTEEGGISAAHSMWYLERKAKNEGFSARTELTGAEGEKLYEGLDEKQKEKLNALLDEQAILKQSDHGNES